MKRYLGVISAIIISLLLSACNSSIKDVTIKSPVKESEEVDIDVEKKIREIKENLQEGFEVIEIDEFFLTGNITPEIVEVTAEKVPDFESGKVVVTVYQYSLKTKEWEVALKREEEDAYEIPTLISDEGQVAKDGREQIVVSKWEGSGGFLSFFILGSPDKKNVSILLDKWSDAYSDGLVHFEKGKIGISENGTISNTFKWDGKSLLALDDYNDASYQDNQGTQSNETAIRPITHDELPTIGSSIATYLTEYSHKMQQIDYLYNGFEFWFGQEENDGKISVSPPHALSIEDPLYRLFSKEDPLHEVLSSEDDIYIYVLWIDYDLEPEPDPEELRQIALKTLPSDAKLVQEGPDRSTTEYHLYYKSDSIKARTGFGYIEITLLGGAYARILLIGESDKEAMNYMNFRLGKDED